MGLVCNRFSRHSIPSIGASFGNHWGGGTMSVMLSPTEIPKLLIHFTIKGRYSILSDPKTATKTNHLQRETEKTVLGATVEEEQRGGVLGPSS
jgi:hypothetical protein